MHKKKDIANYSNLKSKNDFKFVVKQLTDRRDYFHDFAEKTTLSSHRGVLLKFGIGLLFWFFVILHI